MEKNSFKQEGLLKDFWRGGNIFFPINFEDYERIPLSLPSFDFKYLLSKYQTKLFKEGKLNALDIYFLNVSSTDDQRLYYIHGNEPFCEY